MFLKKNLKYFVFVFIASLFIGICFTLADFIKLPFREFKDFIEIFLQWIVLLIAVCTVVYLTSINKYVFLVLYPLICILSSILAYFRYTIGTTLTTMILDATLHNDMQTTKDMITSGLILFVTFSVIASILLVVYRIKKVNVYSTNIHWIVSILFFLVVFNIQRIKNPISERIPLNVYFITSRYFSEKQEIQKERASLFENVICNEDDELIVAFVIGESLRPDHLGFNAYCRNTTPYLSNEDVISFPNIYSEYTYTNTSLPHILTRADSVFPERAYSERSFIDAFKHCGFYNAWLANQEPSNTYVYFMHECDTLVFANANRSVYVFDYKWIDMDLFPFFEQIIQKQEKKKLIILHTIGSHWYYNAHYTDEFQEFNPTIKSRIISSCAPEELINSYDNTILCTDYFLYNIIEQLRDKNAILFYLSDHGEGLGENGIWLHAADTPPLHNPACFIWMSPLYKEKNMEKYDALQVNKHRRYRTDFLFHTITEAAGMKGEIIDHNFSLFKSLEETDNNLE